MFYVIYIIVVCFHGDLEHQASIILNVAFPRKLLENSISIS